MRIRPSRDEFRALAAGSTVVPVWTELLADVDTPVGAFTKVVGEDPGFLLESVEHGDGGVAIRSSAANRRRCSRCATDA